MEYQKAYLLATAQVKDIESQLCPDSDKLASAAQVRGQMPIVPNLEDQKDLTKLVAILLSTGINRNDDAFLPSEILPVRTTGAHKPVNLEHDPTQIIGHMLRTFATEKNGKRVPDGNMPQGKSFDITAETVIYSFLFPELSESIKDRASQNSLFVSVEVWFTDFDFLVGNQIVKRNSDTASRLEANLKINGGNGSFEGKRLGRVLRNMIIGGIGIVKDPANPESVIKSVSSFDSEVVQEIEDGVISQHILCNFNDLEQNVDDSIVTEVDIMNEDIIEEMAALASAMNAVSSSSSSEENIDVAATDSPELKAIASRLEILEAQNAKLQARASEAEFKAEATRRASLLSNASISEDLVGEHLTRCFNMTKEEFDNYAQLLVDTLNSFGKSESSALETEVEEQNAVETAEGGDAVGNEVEDSLEETTEEANEVVETETQAEVEVEVEAEVQVEEISEPTDEVVEVIEDEIEIDIEAVDPDISTEGDSGSTERSLEDKMADIVSKLLGPKDKKWELLSTKEK